MAAILGSNEYFNLGRVGNDNSNWVVAVFQDVLGRQPSNSEIAYWVGVISAPNPRSDVAHMILTSVEYQNDIIRAWYQHYLGRAATDAEAMAARNTINGSGGTHEQAIAIILGSVEYFYRAGLCATYLPLITS